MEDVSQQTTLGQELPELRAEVTVVRPSSARSVALHRLTLPMLDADGMTYWVDARNTASTYALYELAPSERTLSGLRIARAFTAYQHVDLVQRMLANVTPRTTGLVLPNVASLYRDDDVPAHERETLLEAVLDGL